MSISQHWENVYTTKSPTEVSWFEPSPDISLQLIRQILPQGGSVLDVGAGQSFLVDHLLQLKISKIGVLDISAAALDKTKQRLGDLSEQIDWIVADITTFPAIDSYSVWHDRAVFHFLTEANDRNNYLQLASQVIPPDGHLVIGVFAINGPEKCSGLKVVRYDSNSLATEFGDKFRLVQEILADHVTPQGKVQHFLYAVFQRV